jgi:hypothetical protein
MKKAAIALVLLSVALVATSALAQAGFPLRADVPFNFSANGQQYAAGTYDLRVIANRTVRLRNRISGESGFVHLMIGSSKAPTTAPAPHLLFIVNGNYGYLSAVTDQVGDTWSVRIKPADMNASRRSPSKSVVLALK